MNSPSNRGMSGDIAHTTTEALPITSSDDTMPDSDNDYAGQTVLDIIHREDAHELSAEKLLCMRTLTGQKFGTNTDDQHLLVFMPQLQSLYARVMASDQLPVEPAYVRWAGCLGYKLTNLGAQILAACGYFEVREEEGRNWQQAYAHHQFHPIIEVTLRAVMKWWLPITTWGQPAHAVIEDDFGMEAVNGLEQFVGYIRSVCRAQAFQNRLKDYDHKAKDNFRSGCDYIVGQFKRHARLLVLRIDLYFRPDAKGWGYSTKADRALKNYLRSLRSGKVIPGYLGLIIKRENGVSRGMHFHLMVILDGHLHRSAYHLTQVMGEAWMKRVGTDKGSYFNCYARKDFYRYNGLGLVHVSDTNKLLGIRVALWYMTKQVSELKVDDSKRKNFWRGLMVQSDSNRGAPRKNGDGMTMVKRLLGGERSKYPPGFDKPKTVHVGVTAVKPGAGSL